MKKSQILDALQPNIHEGRRAVYFDVKKPLANRHSEALAEESSFLVLLKQFWILRPNKSFGIA